MTTDSTFDPRVADIARRERQHLLDIAFRMLSDVGLAEDMVQEAFVRLARVDLDAIEDVRGWLVVVVGRRCLDHLRSAQFRREQAAEPGVLDSISIGAGATSRSTGADPADRVTLDDTVRAALLSVLEKLTPAERTAFILHDVFQLPFDKIGRIVGRTPTACRQLASRARRRLQSEPESLRSSIESAEHHLVVERFMTAAAGGDLIALMDVLDPHVSGDGTPGGVIAAAASASGREPVARRVLAYIGPRSNTTLMSWFFNGQPAILVTSGGTIVVVLLLRIRDGLIEQVHAVGDPVGLSRASE